MRKPGVPHFAVAVSPNDSEDLPNGPCRWLYIGGGTNGDTDLRVTLVGMDPGTHVTFEDIGAGEIHELAVQRVWNTGTAATDILALYE